MNKYFILASIFLHCKLVAAEIVQIVEVPTAWKLENYRGDEVVSWYTSSSCINGKISFSNNASVEDKNRFWSVIMVGKTARKKVFVRYDSTTDNCEINSFGLIQE